MICFQKYFSWLLRSRGSLFFFFFFFQPQIFFFSLRDVPDFLHSYLLFPFKKDFTWFPFHGILYELYLQICISALSFIVLNVAFIRFPSILSQKCFFSCLYGPSLRSFNAKKPPTFLKFVVWVLIMHYKGRNK